MHVAGSTILSGRQSTDAVQTTLSRPVSRGVVGLARPAIKTDCPMKDLPTL
jgi:hypothetical protein